MYSCWGPDQPTYCTQTLPRQLMRPLELPPLRAVSRCPVSALHKVSTPDFAGDAVGQGPVEALLVGEFTKWPGGWFGLKTLWFVKPEYSGPVLIRTARIDGFGSAGFGESPSIGHLIVPPGPTLNGSGGYRQAPGATFVQTSGCYSWQVDGTDFSYVMTFQATLLTSE